ncbi:enoyl-CoA hydratase/isomerase family protein [Acinetobacter sp. WCHA55]|uniref:enoyl-CoA hydratase/isomerase family protein n=1 Tax=Acinetobacter sp. WCHA55 TaxID=2004646 RepID=UPI000B3C9F0B|nr:enoyl-CoA hydratase/isomerase family protein [Acinetobacter sp. WCHA55]AYA69234.1 enoyl-CoA hydratase/isomerase family protein [Acinetobacter sp. WCHA55]
MENNLQISVQGHLGVITLDRASHLNALSLPMIHGITQQLQDWHNDPQVQAILINSNSPKAFCAGGDIRFLYDSYQNGNHNYQDYFADEYVMLNSLRQYAKPVVVFLDGYVLGGGFGLAQACHIIVSSEKSRFAMPETAIGFFPDVGATHFLSRLDDIGVYMAVTGEQISSSDALHLDLIDYLVASEQLAQLQTELVNASTLNQQLIEQLIARHLTTPAPSKLRHYEEAIQQHFAHADLAQIEASLLNPHPEHADWAAKILAILQQRSLLAKQISLKLQQVGRGLSLEQCMQLERDLQDIWFEQGDMIEGVRALLIDKDKQPKWQTENSELMQMFEELLPVSRQQRQASVQV